MNTRKLLGLTALALLVSIPASAAKGPPSGRGLPGCRDPKAVSRYLGLSEAQRTAWRALREDLQADVKPIADTIEPLRDELETLLDGAAPEACAVGGVVVQIDAKHDQIEVLREAYEDAFEALLTPAQLERWRALQTVCMARGETVGQ